MPESETILLVEDSTDDVLLIRRAFSNACIRQRLQIVADGLEAIQYLGGEGEYADRGAHPFPFLLLLDLKMPIKDGFDVLEWLRAHPAATRGLRIIVFTGSEHEPSKERALRLGAQLVLIKPLSFHQLEAMMVRLKVEWIEPGGPPPG